MKHTPTPWKTDTDFAHQSVLDGNGKLLADCCIVSFDKEMHEAMFNSQLCKANAAFIVEACNAYESLKKDSDRLEDERDAALESARVLRKANARQENIIIELEDSLREKPNLVPRKKKKEGEK